jgi:hypothetical protein
LAVVKVPATSPESVSAQVDSARNALKQAYSNVEKVGGDWGGHRVKAMQHIQEAPELNQAEQWARAHHDIQ